MRTPIHFWSNGGSVLPLALKVQAEGHAATLSTETPIAKSVGKGLVPRVSEPPKGSLIIFDCTGQGVRGAKYRAMGHPVIGGNAFETIETDRPKGAKLAAQCDLLVPPTFPFKDIPSAIKFLSSLKSDEAWFVKVSGDQVESDTYDAPDAESMIRYLEWVETKGKVEPFALQQKVEGTEVSVNGWFDGEHFVEPFDITFESKHFLTGHKGPRTGCESCVVYHSQGDALADLTVELFEDALAEEKYCGPIDVNSLVNSEGQPQFLEFTARLGFDSTQAWMRLFRGDLGEQLEAFAHGELDAWEPAHTGLSGTLRVSIPPYPVWDEKLIAKTQGLPLDYDLVDDHNIDVIDVMEGPEAAGASGIVCTVGALGKTLHELPPLLSKRADALEIPNKQYRVDPLDGVQERMKALEKLGLLGYKS